MDGAVRAVKAAFEPTIGNLARLHESGRIEPSSPKRGSTSGARADGANQGLRASMRRQDRPYSLTAIGSHCAASAPKDCRVRHGDAAPWRFYLGRRAFHAASR
jgi:hypothetical protein